MDSADQNLTPQPTISGYNVEEGRSFLPEGDVIAIEYLNTGLSREEDPSPGDDADDSESESESPESRLAEVLRAAMLDDKIKGREYMPLYLLRAIMTRERVLPVLQTHYEANQVQQYANLICPEQTLSHTREPLVEAGAYTKVFATLILLNKCQDIHKFISERLSDEKLPFRRKDGTARMRSKFRLFENETSAKEIQACKDWAVSDRDTFSEYQRKFLVHFFKHRPNRNESTLLGVKEPSRIWVAEIPGTTYLPWKKKQTNTVKVGSTPVLGSSMSSSSAGGAYSSVMPFEIGDNDHNFAELLENIGLDGKVFAVKTLRRIGPIRDNPELPPRYETHEEMRKRFHQEADVLWRLDGTVHAHLLTMLTAFTHYDSDGHLQLRFIFPWADCDLMGYWQLGDASWDWNAESFKWMAEQIDGILGAVEKLHEPAHLHTLEQNDPRYGMHADIKPDNILLFRSRAHPRGILVLSDFGLSSFHREVTRSNIPNHLVMGTQGYNPPECDVEGGVVSRSFDIWTLGSLFLDMLTWLLGGHRLLEDFRNFAEIEYITGGRRKMFYQILELKSRGSDSIHLRDDIVKTGQEKWYGIQLNPKLSQWIRLLRDREGCSVFVRDTLELIESKMLRLLARDRLESKLLKRELSEILSRCSSQDDYVFNGKPKPRNQGNIPSSLDIALTVTPTPVYLTPLKDESREQMKSNQLSLQLPVHTVTKEDTLLPRF